MLNNTNKIFDPDCDMYIFVDLQRFPADKAYYIAKELLMTERTYKKDIEVLTVVRL